MGQHKKPLSDIVTDPDVLTSWKDEKNFYIHLVDKSITLSFSESDFEIFVKNIVKTRDVSNYLEDFKIRKKGIRVRLQIYRLVWYPN